MLLPKEILLKNGPRIFSASIPNFDEEIVEFPSTNMFIWKV